MQYVDIFTLVRRNPTSGLVSVSLFILTNIAVSVFIHVTFYSLKSCIRIRYINKGDDNGMYLYQIVMTEGSRKGWNSEWHRVPLALLLMD